MCEGLNLSLQLAKLWLQREAIRDVVKKIDDVMHFEIVLDKLYKMNNFSPKAQHELE